MTKPEKRESAAGGSVQNQSSEPDRSKAPLRQQIQARVIRPHKGDVGRPSANEEIFQGSKEKELK
jgi:hypothetical protein